MSSPSNRSSLLCPNCKKLVSRNAPACPYCGLKKPGSLLKDNFLTRSMGDGHQVIKIILMVNVAFFVFSLLLGLGPHMFSSSPFGFLSPGNKSLLVLGATGSYPFFYLDRWWTLVSANYLHGSLLHIIFNMIALNQLGPLIIREYGVSRMITIYTLSGVGGFLVSVVAGVSLTIGASASICGMIGAALYYGKSRGGTYGEAVFSQLLGWAISIAIFGFFVPGINNWGHGGGMVAGALLGLLLGYKERKREGYLHKMLSTACILLTAGALLLSVYNGVWFIMNR
ncbi:rhomboid family intramembrane serine protease [Desulfosediminicola ganghwensis]|uniref:rhomboid family intramembrane serine protease n=1 Tax=Desulfosediminicola ganghwensis TaxID=2569540 RepID=UPI0010AC41B2|nr:rhomboid family intramembrane serine protease [Desulfosediminicola ganghwensis]